MTADRLSRQQAPRPVPLGRRLLGGPESLICVPLVARDLPTLEAQARLAARAEADVVEWRADFFVGLMPSDVASLLAVVRTAAAPVLVTCRAPAEGGEGAWEDAQRVAILRAALESGADAIDVELATPGREELLALGAATGRPVVLSTHDFTSTPTRETMLRTLEAQQAAGAAVAKLAVMPADPADVTRLLDTCLEARRTFLEVPLIAMAMSGLGAYSRVVGPLYGIDLTFAIAGESSAPGQLQIDALRACRAALGVP